MLWLIDPLVNRVPILKNPEPSKPGRRKAEAAPAPARRRLSVSERERQIVDGAIQFFAENGLGGQLRDLAKSIGVTHALLYHYFPTKQALIDRVYVEVFEGRWRDSWEQVLDDPRMDIEDKLTAFYTDYVNNGLSREFVRILMFSGLMDHTITDRFFAMLRDRLFPRLIRETRRFRGSTSRARPSERELELLMGLHGGMYYIAIRRWIYGQDVHSEAMHETCDEALVRDRVRSYLTSSRELFADERPARAPRTATGSSSRKRTKA
ncbi:TetR/AcrR family transcriptional regulator [Caldimonas thermodepolymerans]|jgi:AcrR family transcriptional regulator|uniref:TetR family transcriptional regulator n=1 Tax=Caldimonas thermodepolymerans TaxID=215580 RepID=A0A2S5T4B4_9BURK|nr:TetR family transcriptional regulator [Caldimonas thermodepolymerans]QPC32663.1 TetR/AcrR family transcriptional regulator [Caldimonas thermodepolymerans]RDI03419.1 TetR family transcriptional regulator [Caldimonas thermodepolymerans]TCP06722.1 TetR family transcriptional regulator [Caldimonas thermodepolymerans]